MAHVTASTRAVTNHWTGLLEWTSGMDYWTDLFCTKNHFYGLRITRSLTCKKIRSINNSIIYFTAQNHTYLKKGKQHTEIMLLLLLQEKAAYVQFV